jgi:hypothetical protein
MGVYDDDMPLAKLYSFLSLLPQSYSTCVFVGKDEYGEVRFAHMRGIYEKYHRDADGGDKRYSFHIPAQNPDSRHLTVFEAPIDALSHATLGRRDDWQWDGHRLSLGGTSPFPL